MATSRTIDKASCGPEVRQQRLFPDILCSAYIVAASAKKAFYRIWIEADNGIFTVRKESGIWNRVLDMRAWSFDTLEEAREMFIEMTT